MENPILEKAQALEAWIIETRREFHQHPEPSMEEHWTTDRICQYLEEFGIPYQRFEESTGCLAIIQGAHPGKTVALRSDMDALRVLEENDVSYKSQTPGLMHACGHDTHVTMNLAAARILNDLKAGLHGTVIHIFQPSEENGLGAKTILAQGDWFDSVDNVFGCHIWSNLAAGKISIEAGPRMASADFFTVDIEGFAGHGAQPEQCVDATVVAAATVMNLQTLVSREVSPVDSLVITVGKMTSGTTKNVISGSARLEGTVRYFTKELGEKITSMMERVVHHTAAIYGAKADFSYEYLAKPVINEDEESLAIVMDAAEKLFGPRALGSTPKTMTGEDFSEYLVHKPGVFIFLGSCNPELGTDFPHHHGCFDIDESVLKNGAALYAQYAYDFLNQKA